MASRPMQKRDIRARGKNSSLILQVVEKVYSSAELSALTFQIGLEKHDDTAEEHQRERQKWQVINPFHGSAHPRRDENRGNGYGEYNCAPAV